MPNKKEAVKRDVYLNGRQCAESIGIAYNSFAKWNVPSVQGDSAREKLYSVRDIMSVYRERCRRELEKEIREEVRAEESDSDLPDDPFAVKLELDQERVRWTRAQADGQELKNEIARHEVAPFEWHAFVFSKTANVLVGMIDSIPVEMMRKLNLTPQEVEKVKGITATALDSVSILADREWLEAALDEFIDQTA